MNNQPSQSDPQPRGEKRGIVDESTPTFNKGLDAFERFEKRADEIVRQLPATPNGKDM